MKNSINTWETDQQNYSFDIRVYLFLRWLKTRPIYTLLSLLFSKKTFYLWLAYLVSSIIWTELPNNRKNEFSLLTRELGNKYLYYKKIDETTSKLMQIFSTGNTNDEYKVIKIYDNDNSNIEDDYNNYNIEDNDINLSQANWSKEIRLFDKLDNNLSTQQMLNNIFSPDLY